MATEKNLNDLLPAAPANARNGKWQVVTSPSGTDATTGQPYYDGSVYMTDMVGDTGTGGQDGLVPAPPAGSAAASKFLKADGTWAAPAQVGSITAIIDGGVSGPATGAYKPIVLNYAATIVGWSIIGDASGSASLDVWFIAGTAPPTAPNIPTSANKISASAPIALSSARTAAGGSSAISTWTTALTQWGTLLVNLSSITTCKYVVVQIFLVKN